MAIENLCMGCMKELTQAGVCPYCGYDPGNVSEEGHYLKPYTILNGKYLVGKVLGEGGFGITYIGYDLNLEVPVAIKEFYPNGFVTREGGVTSLVSVYRGANLEAVSKWKNNFIREARTLAKCSHFSGIVGVKDFFEENGTAYIAMEYLEGMTLKAYVKACGGKVETGWLLKSLEPVMSSLAKVHEYGLIHRDISPDNIMILGSGNMKLLDFGAARDYSAEDEKSLSVMLKPGYAPEEQYRTRGKQGPWSDVYAFAATVYKCITGVTPPESMERMRQDGLKRPGELGILIPPQAEAALLKGMAVYAENRYQSMKEFMEALYQTQGSQTKEVLHQPASQTVPPVTQTRTNVRTTDGKPARDRKGAVTPAEKVQAWCRKYWMILAAATGIVLACVLIAIMSGKEENSEPVEEAEEALEPGDEELSAEAEAGNEEEVSDEQKASEALENGRVKFEEGDQDAALMYFEEARSLNPLNEEVYLLESDFYVRQEDYANAVGILDEGIEQTGEITLETRKNYLLDNTSLVKQEKYVDGTRQEVLEYNPDGSVSIQYLYDADGVLYEWGEYTYENGILTSEVHFYDNGVQKWGTAYNADGSENVYASYDREGMMTEVYLAEYDGNGRLYRKVYYEPWGLTIDSGMDSVLNNGVAAWKIYEYDQNGDQIRDTDYNPDGSINSWQEYVYGPDGNMTGSTYFYADGTAGLYREYVYDENANLLSEMEYWGDGSPGWKNEFVYDALGNCVKELSYYEDSEEAGQEVDYVNFYDFAG